MTYRCNLIINSCCDLPFDLIDREGVGLIRFPYFFGTEEFADDLWRSADSHGFYERMRKGEQPTTAQLDQSIFSTAKNAFCGTSTFPICFMRFFPRFCFSSNLRL